MRRRYYFLVLFVVLISGIVVGLQLTGYLFNTQRIIPPSSELDWEHLDDEVSIDNTSYEIPIILNLTEQMKDIPGIEHIKYEVFVSNDSRQQVIVYYTDLLEKDGYSFHDEYSGMQTYEYAEIYYYTFIKGLNGVVIYVSQDDQHTWVCYSTGDVLQYKEIFKYMVDHNIIS
jgi:hypothetical protein